MKHVRILAGRVGNRTAGTTGYRRAARYVEATLRSFGWVTSQIRFEVPAVGASWTILAEWPGRSRGRVIIGGHLDSVPGSPGGNDNGTGTATVLELARVFSGTRFARRIQFVAFGAEERQPGGGHHYGSLAFVERMSAGAIERAQAMVSVDMIGKDNAYTIAWMGIGPRTTVDLLLETAEDVGLDAFERVTPDWSDNGPFERAGIPAALLWTGDEPNYHSPRDTVANVERPALRNAGRLLVPFILAALR
jgi:Zn-dependent M28 family amino/carboxypeptidase